MKKYLFLFIFLPLGSISQNSVNIYLDKNDSLKKIQITPFISYYQLINSSKSNSNSIISYGTDLNLNITPNFKIYSSIFKYDDSYIKFISDYVDSLRVLPSMNPIEYNLSNFILTSKYRLNNFFSFELGKGKNFLGNGYRSMLLSNNNASYPYFNLQTKFWKIKYHNLYTKFSDIYNLNSKIDKHGVFHFLDLQFNNKLNFVLFEGIIWESANENYIRGFEINYLNPVIFYRPVEFSLNSPDNVLIGLDILYNFNKINFYGQILIDDLNISRNENTADGFFQNKLAFQLGIKSNFLIREHEFRFLTEYNQAQPYTYAHKYPVQNYTHLNQSLAHPLGANFKENIILLNYKYKRWITNLRYTYAIYGADSLGTHYGQNIFISDFEASGEGGEFSYGNYNGQGIKTQLHTFYAEVNYDFKVAKAFLACYIRNKSNDDKISYIVLGIKTNFLNPFLDF